jgi:SulP family sulfate permease
MCWTCCTAWQRPAATRRPVTLIIGVASLVFLLGARRDGARCCSAWGVGATADLLAKLAPMVAVIGPPPTVGLLRLDQSAGVSVVGAVPQGLPQLSLPCCPAWARWASCGCPPC